MATQTRRTRLSTEERERQILDGAIRFFAARGLDGQLRDLASSIGVTHALLYHYFPTKQALIDRVYHEMFESCWRPEWDTLLESRSLNPEEKFTRFYTEYAQTILAHDFVRILIFSGLSDRTISNRFFALLREKLFPRLIRETRKHRGVISRTRPSEREYEMLMDLHGSIFYIGVRRWIYGQAVHSEEASGFDAEPIRDRVRAYLMATKAFLD